MDHLQKCVSSDSVTSNYVEQVICKVGTIADSATSNYVEKNNLAKTLFLFTYDVIFSENGVILVVFDHFVSI